MFFLRRSRSIILFYRQLSVLLRSGMIPDQAFAALEDFPFAAIRRQLEAVRRDLHQGTPLVQAVVAYPELFGRIPSIVWKQDLSCEELGQVFADFADETETISGMKGRLLRALAYPMTTLAVGCLVMATLLIFVIPQFAKMYSDFGSELPGATLALIALSHHFGELALAALIFLLLALIFKNKASLFFYAIAWRLPLFGPVLKSVGIYCFARDLSLLTRLGIPEFQAVPFAAQGLRHQPSFRRLLEMEQQGSLKESLSKTKAFPHLFLQVVGVGERSGKVGEVLHEFSRYYEKEVEKEYYRLLLVTEVVALIAVAVLIGWSVMAMYLPLFHLSGTLVG